MNKENQRRTFISYSRSNKDFALKLAKELRSSGFNIWFDLLDIPTGSRWDDEVERALETSDIFMVILTPASSASDNVKDEIGYAIDAGKRILPVLLENATVPLRLRRFQYVDFTAKSYEEGVKSAKALLRNLTEQPTIPDSKPTGDAQVQQEQAKSLTADATQKKPVSTGLLIGIVAVVVLLLAGIGYGIISNRGTPAATEPSTPTSETSVVSNPTEEPSFPATEAPVVAEVPTETPIPVEPDNGIGNTEGDEVPQVYVPAGEFTMGSTSGDSDELPIRRITLDAFWIDKTEVTNGMYSLCVERGECREPTRSDSASRSSYYGDPEFDDYPVIFVDQTMAMDYCEWAGGRLPTEAEWEKAARGTDGLIYPWGNDDPNDNLLNYDEHVGDTTMVGSYPDNVSPYGAYDMAGNVWEWVSDWYRETYLDTELQNPVGPDSGTFGVVRGGSWRNIGYAVRSSFRTRANPVVTSNDFRDASDDLGFRCVTPE